MQKISRRKIAEYVAGELQSGKATKDLAQQLAAYLVAEKQAHQVELLISDIEAALDAQYGVSSARITTARPLTAELRKTITEFVKKAENAKSVVIAEESVNPDIIGGVTVQTPQGFFDGSVRYQLQQLQALKNRGDK